MKKNLIKPLAWLTCIAMLTSSCSSEEPTTPQTQNTINKEIPFSSIKMDENGQLKMKFAASLANALVANKDLRRLVKEEALKQFDKDYDVMYQLVKNKSLTPIDYNGKSNGKIDKSVFSKSSQATTFRQALLPFFKNEAELLEIEQKLPLLTIFVPDLPLGTFSAETWDVNDENQVPDVALHLTTTNDVPVIGKDGNNYVIEAELTPGFPIIVIKENERVRVKKNSNNQTAKLATVGFEDFEYIDDNFDPDASNPSPPIVNNSSVDQVLIDSYNVWEGYATGGWQRDNIYYGLTPSNTKGPVTYNYKEYMKSFRMTGDPKVAFNLISSNSSPGEIDPTQVLDYRLGDSSGWTDGSFEILVKVYYGSQSSTEGPYLLKGIDAKPSDLFELKYTSYTKRIWPFKRTYIRTEITATKKINLLDPMFDSKIELVTWDLSNYSNRWKFAFEEVDLTTKNTYSEKLTSKFNVNFEINSAAGGILEKVGLKFGASQEQTKENNYVFEYTTTSVNLYESVVPFFDNVINKDPLTGQFKHQTYSTGRIEFEISPIRVQW